MLKIFFFLLFSCGINAQQLESLKILKTKHDSIETQLKLKYQEEIKGKSDSEISEIYYQNLLSRRKNNRERFNQYFSAPASNSFPIGPSNTLKECSRFLNR